MAFDLRPLTFDLLTLGHQPLTFRAWLQAGNLLVASFERGLHDEHRASHYLLVALFGACHHVATLLADGGEHFTGDPMLELTCLGKF